MKNEMDVVRMDERQREAWLRANRATLMVVGLVWLGMIVWELTHHRVPWFMITMVPVFGGIRFLSYLHFQKLS
jgi:hypothetical protein